MPDISFLELFQGIATLVHSDPHLMIGRIGLMLLGFLLMYLGYKGVLEALLMIPMGLGMATVNAGVLTFAGGKHGTLFLDPLATTNDQGMTQMQIDWLQPIYSLT
ncbi:MAG: Na+-translocating decarboxylase subunit beta, partial [Phyllobacteriaceae bacterium]|nr:Na+-translocating decarboxylase subunit beta [Phyllobacteriaceae bacterium]